MTVEDNEGNPASDSDSESVEVTDVLPTVDLTKDVSPASMTEPGGVFTFTLTIHNTSVEPVKITALTDDNPLSAEALALIGTTLDAGESVSVSYPVTHTEAGLYKNTASVTVEDNEGNPASDTDSESVEVTDVLPTIDITKDVSPESMAERGGDFTYKLTIHNTSVEPVEITVLSDDKYDLPAEIDDLVGTTLAADETVIKTFTVKHTEAGTYTNIASITVKDNENNTASDSDAATATVTDVKPVIRVTKTPDRTLIPAPGGLVNYTFVVTNESVEPVVLTSLVDDKFGDLSVAAGLPKTLPVKGTFTFTKAFFPTGAAGSTHTNTVTATANDNENNTATATASATVKFFDGSVVTNTSYCQFDYDSNLPGNQFRLVYRPETQSTYMLNGQNPGQFYYNAFVSGNPGDPVDVTLTVPFPFVNHGANPTHVYNGFTTKESNGFLCFGQGPDVSSSFTITTAKHTKSSMGAEVIVLSNYSPQTFVSTTTIRVVGTIPSSGYAYITSHMEYGLLKTLPWTRSGETAISTTYGSILEPMTYTFNSTISGDALIQSANEFKKVAGSLGMIKGAETYTPKPNLTVELWSGDGKTKLATSITDEDGYYMCIYKHTGKATTFQVKVPSLKLAKAVTLKANSFVICDFDIAGQ